MPIWLAYQDETEENEYEWYPLVIDAPDEEKAREVYRRVMGDFADTVAPYDGPDPVGATWQALGESY